MFQCYLKTKSWGNGDLSLGPYTVVASKIKLGNECEK